MQYLIYEKLCAVDLQDLPDTMREVIDRYLDALADDGQSVESRYVWPSEIMETEMLAGAEADAFAEYCRDEGIDVILS